MKTISYQPFLWMFIVFLIIFFLWVLVYSYRRAIVIWLCRIALAREKPAQANIIICEARLEHWISYDDEITLRALFNLPTEDIPPASPMRDLGDYLLDLFHFFIPGGKS